MIITRSAHEAALRDLCAQLDALGLDESAGIHGPNAIAWQVNAEVMNFLAGGVAILLQLAHPYVAYAVAEHSLALTDARRRFQGTFENIYQMVFGTRQEALESARKIHAVHARIHGSIDEDVGRFRRGHRYQGNDAQALLWVHTTLTRSALQVHRLAGIQLSSEQSERFYQDSKRFALLFGLGATLVPESLAGFERYFQEKVAGDSLAVSAPAREIAHFILKAPTPALEPLFDMYRAVTSALLPQRLRRSFGLKYGARERVLAQIVFGTISPVRRVLPSGFRMMPAAMEAEMRLGMRGSSKLSALMERAMQRGLSLWPSPT